MGITLISIALLSACFLFQITNAQVTSLGACPNLRPMPNFSFERYQGLWFEVAKYKFLPEILGTCIYVNYRDFQPQNRTFKADIVQIEKFTGKPILSPSDGKVIGDGTGNIALNVHVTVPMSMLSVVVPYPYYILETDYDSYVIKWKCEPTFHIVLGGISNMQTIWILARTRDYPPPFQQMINKKLEYYGLNPNFLTLTEQSNCPAVNLNGF